MPTTAPKPEKTYTLCPAGTHVARIYKFMNLGTRFQTYQGAQKEYPDTLVNFSFELPSELHTFTVKEDGVEKEVEKPFAISREFTLSMGPKSNLRPFVEGILGVALTDDEAYGIDLEQLVGKACLITVKHKQSKDGSRTFADITTTAPLMKDMVAPPAVNKAQIQDVNVMSREEIDALPQWLKDKMVISDEYKRRFGEGADEVFPPEEINPEDIPF